MATEKEIYNRALTTTDEPKSYTILRVHKYPLILRILRYVWIWNWFIEPRDDLHVKVRMDNGEVFTVKCDLELWEVGFDDKLTHEVESQYKRWKADLEYKAMKKCGYTPKELQGKQLFLSDNKSKGKPE